MASWRLVVLIVFPACLSPVLHPVTSSQWIPGWRSRTPASRCHWRRQGGRRDTTQQWLRNAPGISFENVFSLESHFGFSLSPDLSLGYDVVDHNVNHGSCSKRQRVRQERLGQDDGEGPQQPRSWLHHAAQLAVPGGKPPGLAHSSWRNTQRPSVEDSVPSSGDLKHCT